MTKQLTVLVAEDEGIVALDLQNRVRRLGYEVVAVVDTGIDAVLARAQF